LTPTDSGSADSGMASSETLQLAHGDRLGSVYELLTAVSMMFGRGRAARKVIEAAVLTPQDRLVDIGCGPGTAIRMAALCCAQATGVDPSTALLRLGRWISSIRRRSNVTFVEGTAERLPLPDATATVVWSLSSVHHWNSLTSGLAEAKRVLSPGGRILLAEKLVKSGGSGRAHRLTADGADRLSRDLFDAGFTQIQRQEQRAGHRILVILTGILESAVSDGLRV
jgi:ubiquinone/menaquinone biosynthesis C-methylase UbiE